MPHYFEDFSVGQVFETPGRTITETDLILFAGLTGDNSALHTDEEHAKTSIYGARLVHGYFVLALAAGLVTRTLIFEGTGIAYLGIDKIQFLKPVFLGDTIKARLEIQQVRETSKPDRGVVIRKIAAINQRGEVVLEQVVSGLVLRRQS